MNQFKDKQVIQIPANISGKIKSIRGSVSDIRFISFEIFNSERIHNKVVHNQISWDLLNLINLILIT